MKQCLSLAEAAEISSLSKCTILNYGYAEIFTRPVLNDVGELYFDTEVFVVELLRYWTGRGRRFRRQRMERLAALLEYSDGRYAVSLNDVLALAHEHQLSWVTSVVYGRRLPSSQHTIQGRLAAE